MRRHVECRGGSLDGAPAARQAWQEGAVPHQPQGEQLGRGGECDGMTGLDRVGEGQGLRKEAIIRSPGERGEQ